MSDNFILDNSMGFNGTFRSNSSVLRLNSTAFPAIFENEKKPAKFDASLETKIFGVNSKINFKAPNYSALFDFGAFRWTKFISGKEKNCWFNPYAKFSID